MNVKIAPVLALVMTVGAAMAEEPSTWYVDDDWYGKEGRNGTAEAPWGTIQEAVSAATTKAGDTILVEPGVYSNGTAEATVDGAKRLVRVHVSKKNLTIRSTQGKEKTHIVGAPDPLAADGIGEGSVSCVCAETGYALVLEDLTIRDGYALSGKGGSALSAVSYSDRSSHAIDCVISNCFHGATANSSSVAAFAFSLHRCQVIGNRCGDLRYCNAENCILGFERHGAYGSWFSAAKSTLVNCLVVGSDAAGSGDTLMYNTIVAYNSSRDGDKDGKAFCQSVSPGARDRFHKDCDVTDSEFGVSPTSLFVAPLFGDFRIVAGSPAIDRGLTENLAKVALPAGYDYRDLAGNPIDTNATACHAGPFQSVVTPQGGCYTFAANVKGAPQFRVDGVPARLFNASASSGNNRATGNYAYATSWPTQWCVTADAPATAPLSCVGNSLFGTSGGYRFAGSDGCVWLMPPPAGVTASVDVQVATDRRYVNPVDGNDAWDGTSAPHVPDTTTGPWRTLLHPATNDVCRTGKLIQIHCAPGTYAEGEYGNSRVAILGGRRLHFIGGGADRTFILGRKSTEPNEWGLGPNALRCVSASETGSGFTGFTFADGYTGTDSNASDGQSGLVDLPTENISLGMTDSIVSNIVSAAGLAHNHGVPVFERCLFVTNNIRGSGYFYRGKMGAMIGCILRDSVNYSSSCPIIGANHRVCNCTILCGSSTLYNGVVNGANSLVYNTIFADFDRSRDDLSNAALQLALRARGCLIDNCRGKKVGFFDCIEAPARFYDKAGGDYRLRADSRAWDAPVVEPTAEFASVAGTDFAGNPVFRTGARLAAGAFTAPLDEDGIDILDADGRLLADGLPADGCHIIAPGESLVISANPASVRPVVGVTLNGETNLFDAATGTLTLGRDDLVSRGGVAATPVLGFTWYVNAGTDNAGWAKGDDANSGFGRYAPKLTLTAGVANAVSNDTVLAAPGRYDQGAENSGRPCRVVIPDFVTLKAEGSPEETFIVGENAKTDPDQYGCGEDATRCVHMNIGSRLVGFTLTGGRSSGTNTSASSDKDGAAVAYGYNKPDAGRPVVSDCIISNNVGSICVIAWVDLVRCRILENTAISTRLIRQANMRDVLIARNRFGNDSVADMDNRVVENVTFTDDNRKLDGRRSTTQWAKNAVGAYRNCVFLSQDYLGADVPVANCLFEYEKAPQTSMRITADQVHLDPVTYRPLIDAGNAVLDAGLNEIRSDAADLASATDASGRPRLSNGRIDIGALEADWNPVYSTRLGHGVTVTAASPSCVTNAAGGVALAADGTLALDWALGGAGGTVSVDVTGDGTLTVSRNGTVEATFTAASDPKAYVFQPSDAAVQKLVFAYEPGESGEGAAAVLRCRRQLGMLLIVR